MDELGLFNKTLGLGLCCLLGWELLTGELLGASDEFLVLVAACIPNEDSLPDIRSVAPIHGLRIGAQI